MVNDETRKVSRDRFVKNFLYHTREFDAEVYCVGMQCAQMYIFCLFERERESTQEWGRGEEREKETERET